MRETGWADPEAEAEPELEHEPELQLETQNLNPKPEIWTRHTKSEPEVLSFLAKFWR